MDIRTVDRSDETVLHRYWEIERSTWRDRPYDFSAPWETIRLAWTTPDSPDLRRELVGAFEDGDLVGAAVIVCPMADNTHQMFLDLVVDPDRRRRGIGSALLEDVVRRARADGRTSVAAEVMAPVDATAPGLEFASARGFEIAIEDGMKVVDLRKTEHLWDALESEIAPYVEGYRLVTYHDVVPDELVDGYCELAALFYEEAPTGELELEREVWDRDRVRAKEQRMRKTRRSEIGTIAVDADGTAVGHTEMMVNELAPWRGFQGGTLVRPSARGHRLGLAVKLANARAARALYPDLGPVLTGNAGVNAAMNAVNERLGFETVERCVELQRTV